MIRTFVTFILLTSLATKITFFQEFDPKGKATVNAATLNEICSIWGVTDQRKRIDEQQLPQENQIEIIEKVGGGLITFVLLNDVWMANLSFAPLVDFIIF